MPSAGPFAGFSQTQPVTNYGSVSIDGSLVLTAGDCTEAAPLSYNVLEINGGNIQGYAPGGDQPIEFTVPKGVFLRVNELRITAPGSISFGGGYGQDALSAGGSGGKGGSGGSGGGGGSAMVTGSCCCPSCCLISLPGGAGGSGTTGSYGNSYGCSSPGAGGDGNALGLSYTYGNGSNGSPDSSGMASGGTGGNGYGGGGGGGTVNFHVQVNDSAGGGGAGGAGGLVAIVGNHLSGAAVTVTSPGGSGNSGYGVGSNGGNGGPGVMWLAFKRKTATNIIAGAGNFKLFKINSDNTLTAKNATDVW